MAVSSVKRLAVTLMDASTDKDPEVQEQIYSSLCFMGEAAPSEVLESCDSYLRQHDKLSYAHRTIILRAMETIAKNSLRDLTKETAKMVILLASNEMTKSKDVIFEWQQAASNVLVAIGRNFINNVMEEILLKFQPGILPHFFIMQTLANLSVANVFGMVPFLNSVLGTMLPMLGMAKQDPMKAVFCVALQHFSESIQEYLANLDKAPDPTVRKDTFSNEIFHAYDVLFNGWLQNRESKVRLAVVEALGPMSHLLPNEKLEEQLPRLIPGILSLYKKNVEALFVTKSLCQILESAVSNESRTLEGLVDSILGVLHSQICLSLDSSNQMLVRNQNEVLRCFTVLVSKFPDHLLVFLLPKLEANNPKVRVGTLIIMKQVINSAPTSMEVKKPLILAAVRPPLQDSSNRVRRAMVQVISAMAHHGYLEQPGGELLLEYLIRLCCVTLSPSNSETEEVTEENVRRISISTLYLISTTVDRMNNILWPYLLEFIVPVQFSNALTPICKSLIQLGQKRQSESLETFLINYNVHINLPSPHALVARLLVVAAALETGDGRSSAALRLLNVMQINIHPTVGRCWDQEIPLLLRCLEEPGAESFIQQNDWEDKMLKFLGATLQAVADDKWISQLSKEMHQQLLNYNSFPLEKNFLYKCIGTTLAACENRELVKKQLQDLLTTARYQEESEREGLAMAFGICSRRHLDDSLDKLSEFLKSDIMKKNMGIFNLFKDRADGDLEKIKSSLILCYGYISVYAPIELVLPRIESDILRNVFLYFHTKVLGIKVEPKDLTLKLCLIRTISMIGLSISNSTQAGFFHFSRKAELLSQLMEFIKSEPPDSLKSAVRQRTLVACTYLVKLEPPLSDANKSELLTTCLSSIFTLPPVGPGAPGEFHIQTLYAETLEALKDLLRSLLLWNLTPHGLQEMFQVLGPWIKSSKEHERDRAMEVSAALLECYLHKLNVNAMVPFYNLGLLIGKISPRCSDSVASVRQHTVDCIYYLLYIQLRYEGFAPDHKDELVEKLQSFKQGLQKPDPSVLYHTCFNVAMIIGKRLPPEQLTSLLFITFEGLSDPDINCSRAATVMVNSLLKDRGSILLAKVPDIITRVQEQLQETQEAHVKKAVVQTIYILATQHLEAVVCSLLSCPLPYDSETCLLWGALSSDPPLTSQVLDLLMGKMSVDVPYKENKTSLLSSVSGRVATLLPLAASCAVCEILSAPESTPAVHELYPQLFVTLLLRISLMIGVQLPKNLGPSKDRRSSSTPPSRDLDPCSCAVEAMKFLLTRGGSEEVTCSLEAEGGWENMKKEETHHLGVSSLSSIMVQYAGPKLPVILKGLQPALSSLYDRQRITATAFLAQLLQSSHLGNLLVIEPLMDNMTARLKDTSVTVRMLAVRGLGNMASGAPDKVRKHGSQLLTSMINAMDDREDPEHIVTQEAMSSLCLLLPFVQEKDIRSLLIHTAIRIRPFFDHERTELRKSSISLFGNLIKFCCGNGEEAFYEQMINGLVTLLLHLQDPRPEVVKACKFALQICAPNMNNQSLSDMFLSHLHLERGLHYGEFMNNVCKHLVQGNPELLPRLIQTNITYFKSIWPDIRAAAPLFIGFLVLHMQEDQTKQVDLEHLVSSLIVLLKDPHPSVRVKASETIGRLVRFV
ncbi:maestro heat-like repeat-containing protein family member 1 isoform X2 [Xenopus laevis]|uniref:Maestro heat-like repeat-containing protein family member 1 isoform X2 n=1 Tax=Xenopus laevis TaxID=8355 RepID=A0A8J1L5D1_XENLA|nr:maestro heat-like repeat-containing protein family member 1 isoform X2 [Xenopus laevis]